MEDLFIFLVSFLIIFIVYLVIYFIKRKRHELKKMQEIRYLVARSKRKDLNYNKLGLIVVLINSLIISSTGTACTMVDTSFIWQLLIGFGMLMALIVLFYGILGFILKKGNK